MVFIGKKLNQNQVLFDNIIIIRNIRKMPETYKYGFTNCA